MAFCEFDSQFWSAAYGATDAPNITVDWNNGNVQYVTIAGNRTLNFSNEKQGGIYTIAVVQGSGGSHLLGYSPAVDKWLPNSTPVLGTTAGDVDVFQFFCINSKRYGRHLSSVPASMRAELGLAIGLGCAIDEAGRRIGRTAEEFEPRLQRLKQRRVLLTLDQRMRSADVDTLETTGALPRIDGGRGAVQ